MQSETVYTIFVAGPETCLNFFFAEEKKNIEAKKKKPRGRSLELLSDETLPPPLSPFN
jgi:hypothetical protein